MPVNWIIKGSQYDKNKPLFDEKSPGIKVWELSDQVNGEPVDARYAIFFIRNLWSKLHEKKKIRKDRTLKRLEELYGRIKAVLEQTKQSEKTKAEINDARSTLEKRIKRDQQWLINLLKQSFGLTFDKSALLKTLSQPGCEGIRFYLCMTDHYEGYELAKEGEDEEEDKYLGTLSLVTVGVDKAGKDLHYEYEADKHTFPKIPDIETQSLPCEYFTKPLGSIFKNEDVQDLEPYVLYKYAMPPGKKQIDEE